MTARRRYWGKSAAADRLGELGEILAYHLEQATLYRHELDLPDRGETGQRAAALSAIPGSRSRFDGDRPGARFDADVRPSRMTGEEAELDTS